MTSFKTSEINELIEVLDEALEALNPIKGGYSGEYLSAEDFYSGLSKTVSCLKAGKSIDLDKLWGWFAPTCEWDDFVGNVELGQRVFDEIEKLKESMDQKKTNGPNLYTLKLKLNRYALGFDMIDDETIQIGGVKNLNSLKLYYIYLPLIIGLIIVLGGLLLDFVLFEACGAVFLLYAGYGITVVRRKIIANKDTKVIQKGEAHCTQDDKTVVLNQSNIDNYSIVVEQISKETYEGRLTITDNDNKEHFILGLFDPDKKMLEEDLDYIKRYIEMMINTERSPN